MTHTRADAAPGALRHEVAGTIGILTDAADFAAMRRYRTFAFTDHPTYLRRLQSLLTHRESRGRHTAVALFDPGEYEEFCADAGLDPDTPRSRARFTAELAASGAAVPYDGRPLAELVPDLVTASVRQATWEYGTAVLAGLGPCAVCGEDIGWAAYRRAAALLARVLDRAGPGAHHLVCSARTMAQPLLAALRATTDAQGSPTVDDTEAREFTTLLATGLATQGDGGIVLRTVAGSRAVPRQRGTDTGSAHRARDRVCGWRLLDGGLSPLTAAEVFDAYCTDVTTGDIVGPEPDVDYVAPPDLGDLGRWGDHAHGAP